MDAGQHSNSISAAWKLTWTWLFVGVSQMGPLQAVQFLAAGCAIVFTVLQTWVLVRDKFIRRTRR